MAIAQLHSEAFSRGARMLRTALGPAIANGTLAAAIALGLRLWIPGALIWAVGHTAVVWAAKRGPQFVDVVRRHLRYPPHLGT